MLFRCSVCRGQFDVEPDRQKPIIYCSHCGAALQTGKPKKKVSASTNAALDSLGGPEPTQGQSFDQFVAGGSSQGYVESYDAPGNDPVVEQTMPIPNQRYQQPSEQYDFAPQPVAPPSRSGMPGPLPPQQFYGSPMPSPMASSVRRPVQKKDNTMMIIIIIGAIVAVLGLVGLSVFIIMMNSQPEPPQKVLRPVGPPPGELFPDAGKGK